MNFFAQRSFLILSLTIASPGVAQVASNELNQSFRVTVTNPLKKSRGPVLVLLAAADIKKQVTEFNPKAFVITLNGKEIAGQYNFNQAGLPGIVTVLDSMGPEEVCTVIIKYKKKGVLKTNYTKRTQAELSHKTGGKFVNREYVGGVFKNVTLLRVPPEHKDHSWFIRYEGPGWESDRVGYRFYLDQRNATDVFGKKTPQVILHQVGHDGFDSYHNPQTWGMDIMKVGKSLGLGTIGAWQNGSVTRVEKTDSVSCRILENGDVYSLINTRYQGWQVGKKRHDLQSLISIYAGTRLTTQRLEFGGHPDSVCTGIVSDKAAKVFSSRGDQAQFGYLATYGKQSLNSDDLGLAVFFDPSTALGFTADEYSHIISLKPTGDLLQYYFLAAWSQEPGGIRTETEFLKHVQQTALELAHPVQVKIF